MKSNKREKNKKRDEICLQNLGNKTQISKRKKEKPTTEAQSPLKIHVYQECT